MKKSEIIKKLKEKKKRENQERRGGEENDWAAAALWDADGRASDCCSRCWPRNILVVTLARFEAERQRLKFHFTHF